MNSRRPDLKTTALLALLALPAALSSQTISPGASFRLDADAARFAGGDSTCYVEVYYGIPEAGLTHVAAPGGYRAAVEMSMTVSDSAGVVATKEWTLPLLVQDTSALRAPKNILSYESLSLPGGAYRVRLSARDSLDPSRADSAVIPVLVRPPAGRPGLSDIELCSRVASSADRASPFYKNTLEVIPNPARLYGEGLSVVHFYVEAYDLDRTPGPPVLLRASIRDARGAEVVGHAKPKPRSSSSSAEFGSMNVASLPGGSYVFRVSIEDTSVRPAVTLAWSEKKFFVYNPAATAAAGPAAGPYDGVFAGMSEAGADDEIRKVRYIATDPERRQAEQLAGLEGKRNYLKAFWTGRASAAAEPRQEYFRKVREADEKFRERNLEGWLTDRGRVWIVYGPPDNVERHPSQPESRPYEIWEYQSVQGGVVFVFVDQLGFGQYRLVHSNHRSELRNDDWYRQEAEIR